MMDAAGSIEIMPVVRFQKPNGKMGRKASVPSSANMPKANVSGNKHKMSPAKSDNGQRCSMPPGMRMDRGNGGPIDPTALPQHQVAGPPPAAPPAAPQAGGSPAGSFVPKMATVNDHLKLYDGSALAMSMREC